MPLSWFQYFHFSRTFACFMDKKHLITAVQTSVCHSARNRLFLLSARCPSLFSLADCLWGTKTGQKPSEKNCERKQKKMYVRDVEVYFKVRERERKRVTARVRENELLRERVWRGPFSSCEGWNSWTRAMKCICLLSLILFHIIQYSDSVQEIL